MTVSVVDGLEMIDVKHEDAERFAGSPGALEFAMQEVEDGSVVPEFGAAIVHGLEAQFFSGLDQLLLQGEDSFANAETSLYFSLVKRLGQILVGSRLQGSHDGPVVIFGDQHNDVGIP